MLIDQDFKYRLYADGLPSATIVSKNTKKHTQVVQYHEGIPVGFKVNNDYYLYNHFDITIKLHKVPGSKDRNRIVGFEVEPHSLAGGDQRLKDPKGEVAVGEFHHLLEDAGKNVKKQEMNNGDKLSFSYNIKTV